MPQALANHDELQRTARELVEQGFKLSVVCAKTGVKQPTLRTWINRGKWNSNGSESEAAANGEGGITLGEEKNRSERVKERLARELENQSRLLDEHPPKSVKELGNAGGVQGRMALVQGVVETADKLFGWSTKPATNSLFNIHRMSIITQGEARAQQELKSAAAQSREPSATPPAPLPAVG